MPFLSQWDVDDHGGSPISYHIVQHPQTGFLYLGNGSGLIEFDGVTWRLIPLPNEGAVPIVVIEPRGRIWMGGTNRIAELRPDARGELQAVDATERLPEAERNFGRLYLGAAAPDGVYFASPSRLIFLGDDGTVKTWPSGPAHFNGLVWLDGALHASRGPEGLTRLVDGAFETVAKPPRSPNPALKDALRLFAARAEPGGGALLLTDTGPMRWAGRGAPIEPVSGAVAAEFARESATTGAFLPDGRFAFGFRRQSPVVLGADGAVSMRLQAAQGFPRGQAEHLAADNQGGLWLALVNGLARLQIDSPYATHGALAGARAFLRHGDRLYVSLLGGVGWRDDAAGGVRTVAGMPASPTMLFAVGERVFATGQYLREILPDDRAVVALELPFNSVTPLSRTPGAFVGTGVAGLRLLRFDGHGWHDRGLVTGVRGGLRYAVEDREGYVWAVGYEGSGSWRVDFGAGPEVGAPAEYFDPARGLPFFRTRDVMQPIEFGGETVMSRAGALLRYERTVGRFVPEDRFAAAPALRLTAAAPGPDGDHWWSVVSPASQIVHAVPAAENRWRVETLAAGPLQGLVPPALHYDAPTRTLWLGSRGGSPVTVDPDWRPAQTPAPLRAGVRRLSTAAGDLLWADSGGQPGPTERPAPGSALALDATRTSLRFAFAAPAFGPDYRGVFRTVFRTRLDGLEDDWTPWSATPWREFPRLPFGDFVFRVQARDVDGRESTVGALAFAIAPPWWRTGWFVVLGGAAGIGAIAGTGRWLATRALRRRVQLLEAQSAVERERLRLARDLHDEVGSGLGRVILFAEEAERVKADPEKLQVSLGRVRSSAQDLVQHAREIVWAVSPQNDTLASVIDRFGHYAVETLGAAGIACAVVRPEAAAIPPVMLGAEVRHSLFLALKEAVHNCVKYSAAKTAELRLTVSGGEFMLVLRDHGRGFAAGEVRGSGYGTASIIARANVLGGSAEITSEVGQGTTVMLRVPLDGPRGAARNG